MSTTIFPSIRSRLPAKPIIRDLPAGLRVTDVLASLGERPGFLWLDSAAGVEGQPSLGRYSFLMSDPLETLVANVGGDDPWPRLRDWCARMPRSVEADLPPMTGGIAGLIGYESGAWLENVGVAAADDSAIPAMALGLYDHAIVFEAGDRRGRLYVHGDDDRAAEILRRVTRGGSIRDDGECGEVASGLAAGEFRVAVADIVDRIRRGDSFQVNLAQRLSCRSTIDPRALYSRLRSSNAAPFGGYFNGGSFQVLSSSPERFLRVDGRDVETRPIKGTIRRTGDGVNDLYLGDRLRESEKDRAENIMIVDLMRNDLSRVCEDDSVRVDQLCSLERYAFVQHLVSVVRGRLRDDRSVIDLLMACFPGGSITGAPKIEAMRTIATLERHRRGAYCGSLGYIGIGGQADFNILIRTITAVDGQLHLPVGGGITARSDPAAEEAETWTKAEGMLRAIRGCKPT